MNPRAATMIMTLFAGCQDDAESLTWGDAQGSWASSWCDFTLRCDPAEYASAFAIEACEETVVKLNCDAYGYCDARYPHPGEMLSACERDMADLGCDASFAPESCYRAFASD